MSFDTHLRMSGVRPQSNLFNPTGAARSTGGLRKSLSLSSRCSWKCTAILFMLASAVLVAALAYLTGKLIPESTLSTLVKKRVRVIFLLDNYQAKNVRTIKDDDFYQSRIDLNKTIRNFIWNTSTTSLL